MGEGQIEILGWPREQKLCLLQAKEAARESILKCVKVPSPSNLFLLFTFHRGGSKLQIRGCSQVKGIPASERNRLEGKHSYHPVHLLQKGREEE